VENQKTSAKTQPESSVLVDAAKAIGRTAGKVAHLVGVAGETAKAKSGKFPKTDKKRLPRREKKALQTSAQRAQDKLTAPKKNTAAKTAKTRTTAKSKG